MDAVIVGDGLHGLSAAIHLAAPGLRVTRFEAARIGRNASGANAGRVRRLGHVLPDIPLAITALDRWHRISDFMGDDCDFAASHQIKVAEASVELSALKDRSRIVQDFGFDHE